MDSTAPQETPQETAQEEAQQNAAPQEIQETQQEVAQMTSETNAETPEPVQETPETVQTPEASQEAPEAAPEAAQAESAPLETAQNETPSADQSTAQDMTQEQNRIEAEMAVDQLAEQLGKGDFRRAYRKTEGLLKALNMQDDEQLKARLEALHKEQYAEQAKISEELKAPLEAQIEKLAQLIETEAEAELAAQNKRMQDARDLLEATKAQLIEARFKLIKSDEDELWTRFKSLRNQLKKSRNKMMSQVGDEADRLVLQAKTAIAEGQHMREVRETFKSCQKQVNSLPMRRQQRQQYREQFDVLWQKLQARSQQDRENRKQRHVDGKRKMEEALERVEGFIKAKSDDVAQLQERMSNVHWDEVDRLEKQLKKSEASLKDAKRRQRDLQKKLGITPEQSDQSEQSKSSAKDKQAAAPKASSAAVGSDDSDDNIPNTALAQQLKELAASMQG